MKFIKWCWYAEFSDQALTLLLCHAGNLEIQKGNVFTGMGMWFIGLVVFVNAKRP